MSKNKNTSGTGTPVATKPEHGIVVNAPVAPTQPKPEPTRAELDAALGKAMGAKDIKAVLAIAKQIDTLEKNEAEAKKAGAAKRIAELTGSVRTKFLTWAKALVDTKALDGCDGIWASWDFGSTEQEVTIRLMRNAPRKERTPGSGSGSYVANDTPSKDLLAKVGSNIMFPNEVKRTIDKVEHTIPAGMTFEAAYKYSSNGGWRNQVRQALLKEAGLK